MFHSLSSKVMENAFEKTTEIVKKSFPDCQSNTAWILPKSNDFTKCTKKIGESHGMIIHHMENIENVAANNLNSSEVPVDVQIGQMMEGLDPFVSDGLDFAINVIKNISSSFDKVLSCSSKLIHHSGFFFICNFYKIHDCRLP